MNDDPHAPLLAAMRKAALDEAGELDPALRSAAANNHGLPEPLAGIVDKIARHAYRVTDDDVSELKKSGYTEDQIFELVVAAAVGAASRRADAALAALQGALAGRASPQKKE
jgi:alkylhydroperoxidase family enzyme